ncbi:MAG: hypothetical protein ACI9WU_002215 [Myxococcota bacterium]
MHDVAITSLTQALADRGLDLVQPLGTAHYNAVVQPEYQLRAFGRSNALALVVGNTRSMWPAFLDAARPEHDPLDRWVERVLADVTQALPCSVEVYFPADEPPRRLPFQRLASIAGLAWLSPSWLLIHPEYGPWVSLRALIVLDCDGPDEAPDVAWDPCGQCVDQCGPLFEAALADTRSEGSSRWLAVRDACPLGRQHRFSPHQIAYHYDKNLRTLWHQPFYCEENAYRLSLFAEHRDSVVVFISNTDKRVALWSQRAGRESDGLILWDYHVVLLGSDGLVRDPDCRAGERLPFADWAQASFPYRSQVPSDFAPLFRVVSSAELHATLRSDRSHMRLDDGSYAHPPPVWPAISVGSNLMDFVDMGNKETPGIVCDLEGLSDRATKMLAPVFAQV